MNVKHVITSTISILVVCIFAAGGFAQLPREQRIPEREYVIGIADQLNIQVVNSSLFSRGATVRTDGKITLPLLGDIQAAGLKVSMLKSDLKERFAQYLRDPEFTLSVGSSQSMQIKIHGPISQELELPRGTTVRQFLSQYLPSLRQQGTPVNLTAIQIIGVDEEFTVNGQEILAGREPLGAIRLEWGDEIVISPPPSPTPEKALDDSSGSSQPIQTSSPTAQATFTPQAYQNFLQVFPHAKILLQPFVTITDEQVTVELGQIPEEHKILLGDDVLREIEGYIPGAQANTLKSFTDITLAGIFMSTIVLEAFLAIPPSEPEGEPVIQRLKMGEPVQDAIFLESIGNGYVVLRKDDAIQRLFVPDLSSQLGNLTLAGILHVGERKSAIFTNTESDSGTVKNPLKNRFYEGDLIGNGIVLAEISQEWVRLEKAAENQLFFLRKSLSIPPRQEYVSTQKKQGPGRILLVGDSTVATHPLEKDMRGWGQLLPEFFIDGVDITNLAKGGKSSKSFIEEGLWAQALSEAQTRKVDYIFIQFGHNDSRAMAPHKTNADEDFITYLQQYIDDTRRIGAIPIFVTSMSRFIFTEDGEIDVAKTRLQPYVEAMKQVAVEKNVTLIDLFTSSIRLFNKIGEAGLLELRMNTEDDQHFGTKGARKMAELIVMELPRLVPRLALDLKGNL